MDSGPEAITEAEVLAQVRRQARGVWIKSVALGLLAVGVSMVGPVQP